ncbi:MAG: hypothetical protein HYW24_00925 [Candidatus Aenigmarchaeota archaeon]|nr:hypothetical protein [Candidatus Aenigmarchaeota archaeon]
MPLDLAQRTTFEKSLYTPWIFNEMIRPVLYLQNHNDPEAVHEDVLNTVGEEDVIDIFRKNQRLFQAPENLRITLNGRRLTPFGTAAGMDKNGDALLAFSYVFGFQETGTVVVNPREGNKRPRVATDNKKEDLYNAQGFPSRGLSYFKTNLANLRDVRGKPDSCDEFNPSTLQKYPLVYVSICGLPMSEENAIDIAMKETETLVRELELGSDAFVWNPFSPNTATLTKLRTPQIFKETAELIKKYSPAKLLLVKMGPYEDNDTERKQYLDLVSGFLEGGGHGVVAVNTKMFPKEQIPAKDWGYPSGGRSGRFLKPYRMRAVSETRKAFPNAVIFATGGIYDGNDAYETFKSGATALEGYTPYTFHGLGLLPRIQRRVAERLRKDGYKNLEELQLEARHGANLVA